MSYFVVEHDRSTGENSIQTFSDGDEAVQALNERERRRAPDVEVVLLYAASLDHIRQTHSRYFETPDTIFATLRGRMASATST